ncbi:MAG: invasion associated locus B family protein, partial [Alphaproteobacteria bacterium]
MLVQDIIFRQSGKRVLNVSIVSSGQKNASVVAITAPLGILLPAGLTLVMDDTEAVKLPLRLCNVNGCQGSFPFAS